MAPYSSPAPSLRSIQYSAPIRSLALNWASAQLFPAFSSPSRRTQGHGTRPVGLRVLRPSMAMMCSLQTRGRCRPESYEGALTEMGGRHKHIARVPRSAWSGRRLGVSPFAGGVTGRAPPPEAVGEGGVPAPGAGRAHGLGERSGRPHQDDELLGAGDG